jgi:hypothetical protein
MARCEFQMPDLLRHDGPQLYWYIRYVPEVLDEKNRIERKEVWHRLGDCDQITKRQAMRLRDEIIQESRRGLYNTEPNRVWRLR